MSDHHVDHKNIIKYEPEFRPFADTDEMWEYIKDKHNSVVNPGDEVFFVGDWSIGKDAISVPKIQELNGDITLISGNHDSTFQLRSKAAKMRLKFIEWGFADVVDGMTLTLKDGTNVLMDHFPYKGDHGEHEERYTELRPRDEGMWLIHGHVHSMWKVRDRMINVGVEAWDFTPVSEDQILEIIHG